MGLAKWCIWNTRDLLWRREKKKDGFSQVVDLKLTKNIKGKQRKKMRVGQRCVFEWWEIYHEDQRKKRPGWLNCGFEIKLETKKKMKKKWWVFPSCVFEM